MELLLVMKTRKEIESMDPKEILEITKEILIAYQEKKISKKELIDEIFSVPCYIGKILNAIRLDLQEEDFWHLYSNCLDKEEEYLLPIYDLDASNQQITPAVVEEYLKKYSWLKLQKEKKNTIV